MKILDDILERADEAVKTPLTGEDAVKHHLEHAEKHSKVLAANYEKEHSKRMNGLEATNHHAAVNLHKEAAELHKSAKSDAEIKKAHRISKEANSLSRHTKVHSISVSIGGKVNRN